MEKWLASGGNLRVMHNPALYPAGVGISLETKADGIYVTGEVVEPTAMRLTQIGALRAFSVGINGAKIVKDARAPGGRIVGGNIVELSLVDRPANPNALFSLTKSDKGGNSVWDGTLLKADDTDEDRDGSECPTCDGTGKIREGHRTCPTCGGSGNVTKSDSDDDDNSNPDDAPNPGDASDDSDDDGGVLPVRTYACRCR